MAGSGERSHLMFPGPSNVGIAMQQKQQRPRSLFEKGEFDPVGDDASFLHFSFLIPVSIEVVLRATFRSFRAASDSAAKSVVVEIMLKPGAARRAKRLAEESTAAPISACFAAATIVATARSNASCPSLSPGGRPSATDMSYGPMNRAPTPGVAAIASTLAKASAVSIIRITSVRLFASRKYDPPSRRPTRMGPKLRRPFGG